MIKLVLDIETSGLHSIEARITCISIYNINTKNIISFCEEDEEKILKDFWNFIKEEDKIITFNGDAFDIPFILKRSLIKKVIMKKLANTLDLRKIVNSFYTNYNKFEKGTLSDWAKILGFGEKKSNGKAVLAMFEAKDWKGIRDHCEEDVKLTYQLYKRSKEVNLIGDEDEEL